MVSRGLDGGTLKSFVISAMTDIQVSNKAFMPDPEVHQRIEEAESIWYGDELTEVLVSVSARVALISAAGHCIPGRKSFTPPQREICSLFPVWLTPVRLFPDQILDARG